MKSRLARATYSSLFFLGIMLIVHSPAYSSVLYVKAAPEGDDSNNGLSWSSAKATVKGAIAVASSGDEVWVKAGTYYEQVGNRIAKTGALDVALYGGFKGTETRREQRNWRRNATVLHGDGNGAVVTISGGAGSKTCVDGFQITHGSGGIVISNSAPIIANNTIKGNTGPGISIAKYQIIQIDPGIVKHPLVTRNTIVDNVSINGGGIVVVGDLLTNIVPPPPSSPKITDNFIARNRASLNGGGIGCWGHTAPFIANNCIYANSANNYEPGWDGDDPEGIWSVGGGGIFATSRDFDGAPVEYAISAPTIVNNVLAVNGALLGGGICLVNYKQLSREKILPLLSRTIPSWRTMDRGFIRGIPFPRFETILWRSTPGDSNKTGSQTLTSATIISSAIWSTVRNQITREFRIKQARTETSPPIPSWSTTSMDNFICNPTPPVSMPAC